MTNSTIAKNQVKEHFPGAPQGIVINSERFSKKTEAPKIVQSEELFNQKNAERERMHWIAQKLSQRSYATGYKGL